MSFIRDLARYIADNSILVMDTTIFVGDFLRSSPDECVVVTLLGGGGESESGIVGQDVHVVIRSRSYPAARALAYIVFDILKPPEGYDINGSVFTTEIINMPYMADRDGHLYLFAMDITINRQIWEVS